MKTPWNKKFEFDFINVLASFLISNPRQLDPFYLALMVLLFPTHTDLWWFFSPFLKSRTTLFSAERIIHWEIVSSFNFLQNKDTIGWRPFRILLDKILTLKIGWHPFRILLDKILTLRILLSVWSDFCQKNENCLRCFHLRPK